MPLARNGRGVWGVVPLVTKGSAKRPDEAASGSSRAAAWFVAPCLPVVFEPRYRPAHRRRSGENVELVAVGQAGERVNPLSQTLMHIATRGEKWFALSNHERQQLIEALRRSG